MTIGVFSPPYAAIPRPGAPAAFCYVQDIPPFADAELARLYGHVHSSRAFFETSRPTDNVHTYVAHAGKQVSSVFVFRRVGGIADVLNEFITVDEDEVRWFADYVFSRFPDVRAIRFHAVRTGTDALSYPFQKHNSKENWVITLPASSAEYTASLGKATRDKIKRCGRKLLKDFPSLTCEVYEGEAISEDSIRELIKLSEARIRSKKKIFGIDEEETQRIIRLARRCGMMNVMRIDGRLCAGMLTYRVGTEYLGEVLAHDSQFNAYKLGMLCCHATICESIARGGQVFHLGGGRQEYKARFQGVCQDMDRLVIYRSLPVMALSPRLVMRTAAANWQRRAKLWLLAHEKSAVTRSVFFCLSLSNRLRWDRD